jgi:UTP--glucose-1-phosphate uridylyltransferase
MADRFDNGSIVAVQTVPHNQTDKYGIVKAGARRGDLLRVERIVEKPKPAQAPSNLAVVGRYLLTPRVFTHLERIGEGAGGEIQLTDGIARLMNDEAVYAYKFHGKRFDCGSKLGYLQANVEYALSHEELAKPFKNYLRTLRKQLK